MARTRKSSTSKPRRTGRDAKTGRFIPVDVAKRRKATAIVEILPKRKR